MADEAKNILLCHCSSADQEKLASLFAAESSSFRLHSAFGNDDSLDLLAREEFFLVAIFTELNQAFPQQLVKKIIASHPRLEILLVLPPDNERIRNALPGHPGLHIIERPFEHSSIVHLARELATHKQPRGFTGTLKIVRLDDLIQMCCLSGATITIQVSNQNHQGLIFIREGEIIHARCGELCGVDAFYRIMAWDNGDFTTIDGIPYETVSIDANYQYLLIEAARLSDETSRAEMEKESETSDENILLEITDSRKLRVLMVEDSSIMAKIISTMLQVAGDIEIVGIAHNGREALAMMEELNYDIVMLDVNMPIMNGQQTMKHIMIKSPCPVVVMSNVGSRTSETVLQLLDLGAADFISKPIRGGDFSLQQQKIVERVRRAARANISAFKRFRKPRSQSLPATDFNNSLAASHLVVVTSGCSGHGALYQLLAGTTAVGQAAMVSLNAIPASFLSTLADHLKQFCQRTVTPLTDGLELIGGKCYIDSLRRSLLIQTTGDNFQVRTLQDPKTDEYGPSFFDLFLFSAADIFQQKLLVILLSGAETGTLEGLDYVRNKGGSIFVQAPESCLMPEFSDPLEVSGLVNETLAPEALANRVMTWTCGL
jgi:two-component system chemotaxis response regulator CheB